MPAAKRWLAAITAASIGLRLVAVAVLGDRLEILPGIYDQISYHTLATRLLSGHGFTFAQQWWPITAAGTPTAHWSYLYTLWLSALYAVFGPHLLPARIFQAVITGALTPILAYRISQRVVPGALTPKQPHWPALAAAAWTAGYGYFVYYSAAIMTEAFYITGILWVLDCVLRLVGPGQGQATDPKEPLPASASRWRWAELGLAVAVTGYLRQVFLVCVPILVAWLAAVAVAEAYGGLRARAKAAWQRLAGGMLLAGVVAAGLIAPATVFNFHQFGRLVLLNTNAGYAFFWANHPIYGDQFVGILPNGISYTDLIPPELRPLNNNEAALESALMARGLGFVLDDPARYLRLSLSRIPVYFLFGPSAGSGPLSNLARVVSFGLALPFMLAGLGLWLADLRRRDRRSYFWRGGLLVTFMAGYSLIHLLSWALPRYRLPVDAVGLIFAARALVEAVTLLRRRTRARQAARIQARGQPQARPLAMTGYQTIVAPAARAEASGQRVAVVYWHPADGMASAIAEALAALGYTPLPFAWDAPIPAEAQVIFSQGPYGRFLSVPQQLSRLAPDKRPSLVHWNDEGWPDLRLPWPVTAGLAAGRSWVGRMDESSSPALRRLGRYPPATWLRNRMKRFSYLGDYRHAFRQGWLTLLVDFSQIYAGLHSAHGLPTLAVPWGAVPSWSADLGLERDIDVLWMGARASRRRSRLLDRVREELRRLGIEMYMADNEEHPFIFGEERTRILNRAKITLNLTRTWYDDNFLRFPIVMPNGSLVVSEPLLPHCPDYVAGTHYVAAPIPKLAETLYHYLAHADERQAVVDNARQLMSTHLTLENCVRRIMAAVAERQPALAPRRA